MAETPLGDDLGGDKIEGPAAVPGSVGTGDQTEGGATPPRALGERLVGRFWGTDISQDPQQWTRLATTITGAIAGANLGSKFPLNPIAGALVGGTAGAFAGAALPEMTAELAEEIGVVPEGYRKNSKRYLNDRDLRTVMEGEALLELVTSGGITAMRLAGRALTRGFVGMNATSHAVAEAAYRNNIAILPVQVGTRKLPRQMVSVFGRFPFLFSPMIKQAQKGQDDLARAYRSLPSRIAPMAAMTDVSTDIMTEASQFASNINKTYEAEYAKLFARADAAGVKVSPSASTAKAREIVYNLMKSSPETAEGGALKHTKEGEALMKWLSQNILPMEAVAADGSRTIAPQSLGQMDVILTKLDEQMKAFHLAGQDGAFNALGDLKTSLLSDMQMNAQGAGAVPILQEFKALNTSYSQVWQELFENSTAKRFGNVRRRGVMGLQYADDRTVPVDKLADTLMMSNSPQMVADLHKMITQPTFNRLTASVLDAKISSAFSVGEGGNRTFDPAAFAEAMGINHKSSAAYQTMSAMLEKSGGLTMNEVEDLIRVAEAMDTVTIPNVSTFVARRAAIGGIGSAVRAMVPGAVAGAAAGSGVAAVGGAMSLTGVIGALIFVGGNRAFSKMISNPASAQILRRVMKQESRGMMNKAVMTRLGRAALWSLFSDEQATSPNPAELNKKFHELDTIMGVYINEWWSAAKDAIAGAGEGRGGTGGGAD